MLIYVNIEEKIENIFFLIYVNFMLIYVNITDRRIDKHIKSIVRNLTKVNHNLIGRIPVVNTLFKASG
jgi:hypothetical protein